MIISKTPFRMSFVGGGSDLRSYYKDNPGCVISTTIDKYIYLSIHDYFKPNKFLLKYSKTEEVNFVENIEHNILREVFKYFDINNVDFNSTADIPAGTGMGSSSAFTAGLINVCSKIKNINLSQFQIVELACKFEIEILNEPIGKQDQFGSAIGGLKYIQFNPDETVKIVPINLNKNNLTKLQNNLLLFYTDANRKASSVLKEQNQNTLGSIHIKNNIKKLTDLTQSLFKDLDGNNIENFGNYLNEAWELKKTFSTGVSNKSINEIYDIGIKNGASGGKLLGAGGGGFLLFYAEEDKHNKIRQALKNLREFKFNFESEGTSIIYNKH